MAVVIASDLRFDSAEPRRWHAKVADQDSYVFVGPTVEPELFGWGTAIDAAMRAKLPLPIGVIVDAHMDRLSRMNRREEPVAGGALLPPGFELVYASADAGAADYLGNRMIARCDARAAGILWQIESDPSLRGRLLPRPGDQWMAAGCAWPKREAKQR